MTVLVAMALTAIVVGVCVAAITGQRVRSKLNEAIGGRATSDPIAEQVAQIKLPGIETAPRLLWRMARV